MVVTEFGIAELRGKSFKDRARSLLKIAHPSHQEALEISLNDNPSFY
jgi:4-hydroxybutyrate CoA-transferase